MRFRNLRSLACLVASAPLLMGFLNDTTWVTSSPTASGSSGVLDIAAPPASSTTNLYTMYVMVQRSGQRLFRSADHGVTWAGVSVTSCTDLESVGIAPAAPSTVMVASNTSNNNACVNTNDGTGSWAATHQSINPQNWRAITVVGDGTVRAYSANATGIARYDGNNGWATKVNGNGWDVAAYPNVSNRVYAALDQGVYRSLDDGVTWAAATNAPGGGATAVAMNDNAFGRTANVVIGGVLYQNLNESSVWTDLSSGLPNADVLDIAYDQTRHDLWALVENAGVYRRAQGSWHQCDTGLDPSGLTKLAVDGGGKYAHTGGPDATIWHLNIANAIGANNCGP